MGVRGIGPLQIGAMAGDRRGGSFVFAFGVSACRVFGLERVVGVLVAEIEEPKNS